MRFQHGEHQRMGLHTLVTDKFKTTALVLNIQRPLTESQLTRTALLPHVLTRGTARYPSVREIQRQLDSMYGSYMHGDVYKLGERHIMQFRVEIPNGAYLPGKPQLLREAIAFLNDLLTDPVLEGGAFKPAYVELEKEALRSRVEGVFNNKMQYAFVRAIAAMCESEPFRLFSGGRVEDLAAITPAVLKAEHDDMLAHAPMDLFVVGDVDPAEVEAAVKDAFKLPERAIAPLAGNTLVAAPVHPRRIEERVEVNQGQLVMGLRTPVTYASDDHYAMLMYNGILGGFAHSKLFMNVRERESLAYSTRSRYDAHKGLLMIQAGIDVENYQRALEVIEAQLAAMVQGEISDAELASTQAMLLNTYREAYDSPGALVNLAFESLAAGRERSSEELVAAIPRVTKEDICRVAGQIRLDTVYFLRDKEKVAAHA